MLRRLPTSEAQILCPQEGALCRVGALPVALVQAGHTPVFRTCASIKFYECQRSTANDRMASWTRLTNCLAIVRASDIASGQYNRVQEPAIVSFGLVYLQLLTLLGVSHKDTRTETQYNDHANPIHTRNNIQ